MRTSKLLAVFFMLAFTVQAHAARLVYTGYQDHASNPLIPDNGERVYTLAVQILPTDPLVRAVDSGPPIEGPTLIGVSLVLTGVSGVAPIQLPRNIPQGQIGVGAYQQTQDNLDNGLDPSAIALTGATDSFFYSSPTGQLTTAGTDGPVQVVGDPKLSARGLSPNPYALMWKPSSAITSTNVTGADMSISAYWGDLNRAGDDPIAEASLLGVGVYPLAQIVLPIGGSIGFQDSYSYGITVGGGLNTTFDALGGLITLNSPGVGAFLSYDPQAYLTDPRAIGPVPEPSAFMLAALGIGICATVRKLQGVASSTVRAPLRADLFRKV